MGRFKMVVAAHLLLIDDNDRVLMLRRYNTGYADGFFSVVAGHVDGNESIYKAAIREAREEINIDIDKDNLSIVQVMHRKADDRESIDYFFVVRKWSGEITNNEPNKCDMLSWHRLNQLPDNTVDYIKNAIENYLNGVSFSIYGW